MTLLDETAEDVKTLIDQYHQDTYRETLPDIVAFNDKVDTIFENYDIYYEDGDLNRTLDDIERNQIIEALTTIYQVKNMDKAEVIDSCLSAYGLI